MLSTELQQFTLPNFSNGKSQGSSANAYLACLIDPANNTCRYPDEYSNQTALYSSRSFYDVYGNTAAALPADRGKFSFIIRPVIGAIPPYYSAAQVMNFNPSVPWPADGNFSNLASNQIYQDPNIVTLIGSLGDNGILREIRPVAMSAWFQFTAPVLTLGGHVCSALTDGNMYQWVNNSLTHPVVGLPLQEYRALSNLPNSYNGKITDGTYSFYKPYDAEDVIFQNAHSPYNSSTDYGSTHTYPSIVISGQVIDTSGVYNGPIGRIQVDIVFEYVTLSRLVQSIPSPVNPTLIWNAREALQNYRSCMANDEHEGFIRKILNLAKSMLQKTSPLIGTGLGSVIGGPSGAAIGRAIGNSVQAAMSKSNNNNNQRQRTRPRKPVPKKNNNVQPSSKGKNGNSSKTRVV